MASNKKSSSSSFHYNKKLAKTLAWIIVVLLVVLAIASYPLVKHHGIKNTAKAAIICPVKRVEAMGNGGKTIYYACIQKYLHQ